MDSIDDTEAVDAVAAAAAVPTAAASRSESDAELDNPFQADGELRRKADYIITHSRISRSEVQIADPDSPVVVLSANSEQMLTEHRPDSIADADDGDAADATDTTDAAVEVKVALCVTHQSAPSNAERVKIKKKTCVVM